MTKDNLAVWSVDSTDLFECFAAQLQGYTREKENTTCGDQDVNYALELQQKKLKCKGVQLEYSLKPRGSCATNTLFHKVWEDDKYQNIMECRSCELTRSFTKSEKQIYKKSYNQLFYQTTTYLKSGLDLSDELYVCPNCASVCKIKELQKGCSYCGTSFKMQDLFPKVTNYFFLPDEAGTENEIKKEILKYIKPCCIVFSIGYFVYFVGIGNMIILAVIQGILSGLIAGSIAGYMLWVTCKLINVFRQAGKAIGFLASAAGSESRFVNIMKKYTPEFSYEYFTNKVVSLLKIIMFSKDAGNIPNYIETDGKKIFKDIIDADFYGVALKQCKIRNNYVFVKVNVYMDIFSEKASRITKKSEVFHMMLKRRLDRKIDYNFSIQKIQCKNCGGSFNAVRQKKCPYCETEYKYEDDDWTVLKVEKI